MMANAKALDADKNHAAVAAMMAAAQITRLPQLLKASDFGVQATRKAKVPDIVPKAWVPKLQD